VIELLWNILGVVAMLYAYLILGIIVCVAVGGPSAISFGPLWVVPLWPFVVVVSVGFSLYRTVKA